MATLDDLGLFLQAHGFGTLGQTLFLGTLPEDPPGPNIPAPILGLFEVPGLPPDLTHDLLGPSVEHPSVQLRWRGAPYGYAVIRQQAGQAFRLLGSVVNQVINGVFYQQLTCLQSPHALPADEWDRPSILFEILCARDAQAP